MEHKKRRSFIDGPISPGFIAESIQKHSSKTGIGAHQVFLGQVRADHIAEGEVEAIEFSTYEEMAEKEIHAIREVAFSKYDISCLHIHHSLGRIAAGEICFLVFVSSPHRQAANEACSFLVEEIKSKVPIYGKELVKGGQDRWKTNKVTHD